MVEAAVEAYDGGIEIVSREDMNATWEELNVMNEFWTLGSWWEGMEDKECVTFGIYQLGLQGRTVQIYTILISGEQHLHQRPYV